MKTDKEETSVNLIKAHIVEYQGSKKVIKKI